MKYISNSVRSFGSNSCGNVAMMFGLCSIALVGVIGLAVDFTNAETMRTRLSVAADGAALAGAQFVTGTESERIAKAQASFDASTGQMIGLTNTLMTSNDVIEAGKVTGFRVNVSANVPTTFARIFGKSELAIAVGAQATGGATTNLEVALVLDKTGSMEGAKIAALKTAATGMVTDLLAKASEPDQIRFALVPFSEHVQIGLSRAGEPWLSVPAPVTSNSCWNTYPNATSSNCRMESQMQDGVPVQVNVCDWNYGAPVEVCGSYTAEWRGCVGSRNYPLNVQDGTYTTPVPGLLDTWCQNEVVPLTSSESTVNGAINGMTAYGDTYIPAGIAWGWRMLSPGAPFDESQFGKTAKKVDRYMVLMTDGMNTRSPNYPDNWGSDTALANTLTAELCANTKADGIKIFTIAFEVTDNAIKSILQACASDPTKYFDATNSVELANAFKNIGSSMTALRLSR